MAEEPAQQQGGVADHVARQADAAERTSAHVARQTQAVAGAARQAVDSADRRTELAADRTVLAAERTYAAWVRTGLAALASGVGARTLLARVVPGWLAAATGAVLVLFAGFCFVAAVWRAFDTHAGPPAPQTRRLPAPLLLAVNGFLLLVALAALVGVVATPDSAGR